MGDTYTRQSSGDITSGATIEASHFNNEFDQLVSAFAASSGHTHDGTTGEGGPVTKLLGNTLTFGAGTAGTDITITFDGETSDGVLKWMEDEDYFEFSDDILVASTEKLQFRDTAIYINSSTDGQLDLVADSEIQLAATTIDINGAVALNGAITGATNITLSGELDAATLDISGDADIDGTLETDALSINGTTVTSTAAELNILDGVTSTAAELNILDGVTATASELNILDGVTSTTAELNILDGVTSTTAELNILDGVTSTASELNLVDGITAGTVSASKAVIVDSNKDLTGLRNLTISGDLTVSGDDITMGTNTAGNLLVADGTNFNSIAVGDLSAITSVASDDVLIAVDTSGGGLKKITRSALVSGLAAGTMSDIIDDTSPQLGGDLDTNSNNILIDDAHFIADENGNEQIIFQTTASAVNQFDITNAATGNAPELSATGGDTNISLKITPKGSGQVLLDGNVGVESGTIDLKNSGSRSKINFYCESGNAHAQTLQAAPHSESASNTLTLPSTGGDVDLVSTASTATLTNKTLTSPKLNEDVAITATATEVNLLDGVTATTAELNILDGVTSTAAELNILDGVTSTAAELNILDGVTATATELNIMDGNTSATSTTLADADRMVINDNGTMKQVAVTDMTTYINSNASFASNGFAVAMAIAL